MAKVIYILSGGCTDRALTGLEERIKSGKINPGDYNQAELMYEEIYDSHNIKKPSNYPLKFYSNYGKKQIWVSGVTAGYRGTGPCGSITALRMMGFSVQSDEVFNLPNGEKIVLKK